MNISSINELELDSIDNARSLEYHKNLNYVDKLKVYFPKLMPLIDMGEPKDVVLHVNESIIENNKSTYPIFRDKIISSNYITCNRSYFALIDSPIHYGDNVTLFIKNKNIKNMKFTRI